eukprot:1162134-Pelagomonas_calceolata.AAC.8
MWPSEHNCSLYAEHLGVPCLNAADNLDLLSSVLAELVPAGHAAPTQHTERPAVNQCSEAFSIHGIAAQKTTSKT